MLKLVTIIMNISCLRLRFFRNFMKKVIFVSFLLLIIYFALSKRSSPIVKTTMSVKLPLQENWIVINGYGIDFSNLKLEKPENWTMLIVGDDKFSSLKRPGVIYLDNHQQSKLGYSLTKYVKNKSLARKMIGYLFAIANGAKFIYDAEAALKLLRPEHLGFIFDSNMSGLIYKDERLIVQRHTQNIINPFSLFGSGKKYPAGYPLEYVAAKVRRTFKHCSVMTTSAIQYATVVNGQRDFEIPDDSLDGKIDLYGPRIVPPAGVFAPVNFMNCLYHYTAFPALFIPTTVDYRLAVVWRGYWNQKFLWITGHNMAVLPPNVIRDGNTDDFAADFYLFKDAKVLLDLLSNWTCPDNQNCFRNMLRLIIDKRLVGSEEDFVLRSWFEDLKNVAYRFPSLSSHTKNICDAIDKPTLVHYSPTLRGPDYAFGELNKFCQEEFKNMTILPHRDVTYSFDDILLVITLSDKNTRKVRFLHALYRTHFPNVVFCSDLRDWNEHKLRLYRGYKDDIDGVTMIDYMQPAFAYECVVSVMEMGYNVRGYLVVEEDVVLKTWTLPAPSHIFNSQSKLQENSIRSLLYQNLTDEKCADPGWSTIWNGEAGKTAATAAIREIEVASKCKTDHRYSTMQKYIENRVANGVNMSFVLFGMTNLYYISQEDSTMAVQMFNIFLKHHVYVDIAVPTVIFGLRQGHVEPGNGFLGNSEWFVNKGSPWDFYDSPFVYLYPVMLNQVFDDHQQIKSNYCQIYIYDHLKHW